MMSDQHLYFNRQELSEEQKKMTFGQLKIQSGSTLMLMVWTNYLHILLSIDFANNDAEI